MFLKRFSPGKYDSYLLSKKVSQIKGRIVISRHSAAILSISVLFVPEIQTVPTAKKNPPSKSL